VLTRTYKATRFDFAMTSAPMGAQRTPDAY
jgi:hypothetical protein